MGQVWRLLQNHEREDGTLSTWLERLWKHFDIFLATTVKHVLSHLAMYWLLEAATLPFAAS
jgi:hypothetical protein